MPNPFLENLFASFTGQYPNHKPSGRMDRDRPSRHRDSDYDRPRARSTNRRASEVSRPTPRDRSAHPAPYRINTDAEGMRRVQDRRRNSHSSNSPQSANSLSSSPQYRYGASPRGSRASVGAVYGRESPPTPSGRISSNRGRDISRERRSTRARSRSTMDRRSQPDVMRLFGDDPKRSTGKTSRRDSVSETAGPSRGMFGPGARGDYVSPRDRSRGPPRRTPSGRGR